jgi:hypothetical protein
MKQGQWKTVKNATPRPKKPTLIMVQVARTDWCDEFNDTDRKIFRLLCDVFPAGLTAEQIAAKMNEEDTSAVLTSADIGDMFYGDNDANETSDELARYVVPVNPNQRPKRWRIRAESDD